MGSTPTPPREFSDIRWKMSPVVKECRALFQLRFTNILLTTVCTLIPLKQSTTFRVEFTSKGHCPTECALQYPPMQSSCATLKVCVEPLESHSLMCCGSFVAS